MMRLGALLALTSLFAAGCDKNCQSTCRKVYAESECNVQIAGRTAQNSINECISQCEYALKRTGEMGDYNPYNRRNPLETVELNNEKQAAAWMDCVGTAECIDLDPSTGICAPI